MRARPLLTLIFAAATACAGARARLFGPDPLKPLRASFKSQKYAEVVSRLEGSRMQELDRRSRPGAYWLLGKSHELSGQIARALQTYQLAVGFYPKDIDLLSALADILLRADLGDRARPYYERVLALHPHNSAAHMGMGKIFRKQGDLTLSARHYKQALVEWGTNARIWREYADVLAARRDFPAAAAAIEKALALRLDADSLLSSALIERGRANGAKAYSRLNQALGLAPEREELRLQKALWLLEDGRTADAGRIAAAILEHAPDDPLSRWIRASVALRNGESEMARADLTVAAAAALPHPFIAATARAMLKRLERRN